VVGPAAAGSSSSGSIDGYTPGECLTNAVGSHDFVDVAPSRFYSNAVGWAALNEITTGTDATHFSPDDLVSRAQFATFPWRMVCEPAAGDMAPFGDIVRPSFYAAAVDWLFSEELTTGRTPTSYAPDGSLTRAEFATFLFRLAGEPAGAPTSGFGDVVSGSFYEDAVDWLKWRELTTGTSPTTYDPDRAISRAEAVTFLYRLNLKAEGIIDPADLNLGFQTVLSGLSVPVAAATHPVDGSVYIAEQGGTLVRVPAVGGVPDWGAGATDIWTIPGGYDLTGCNECGLLGVAVSPDGGHIYLSFTADSSAPGVNQRSIVLEYALVGGVPSGAPDELFDVDQPRSNHNGGHVTFGADGYLYASFGDGGGSGDPDENGQDINTLLGKILRVDPSGPSGYVSPADNPYVGVPGFDQIFLIGVRNPWKFSFDSVNGDLWVGDFAQIDQFAQAGYDATVSSFA